jgi:putative ABC transport system permease protein
MFHNSTRVLIRSVWRNKGYGILNIFGLATAIACAALIFLWVEDELQFDNDHLKKDRLYAVKITKRFGDNLLTIGSTPRPMASALLTGVPGIANAARISDTEQKVLFHIGEKSLYAGGRYADSNIFSMFTLPFVQGSPATAFSQLYSLVITEKTASKFFGTLQNVIGQTIRVNNEQDFVVSGVIRDLPSNSSLQFEWLAPYELQLIRQNASLNWDSYGPCTYVELHPDADPFKLNQRLKAIITEKDPEQKATSFLFAMDQWRLYDEFENGRQTGGGRIEQVRMLTAIAWIILLIGCINFMNLATASSQKRSKEVGVRKVLGAGRQTLIFRYFRESLLMSSAAGLVSIMLVSVALPAFNVLMQKQLQLNPGDPFHLLIMLLIVLACTLVAGSYPAIYLASFKPAFVLKGIKQKSGSATLIRKGLVVLQFTVSTVFIVSTIIVYLQIQHVKNRNLGFNKENLIELNLQHDVSVVFPVIRQELINTGLIENAATSDHSTTAGGNTDSRFEWGGKKTGNKISIAYRNVSRDYVNTSGMRLLEGTNFKDGDNQSNIIINKAMAEIIGEGATTGKVIRTSRGNKEDVMTDRYIVGVVDDYVFGNAYAKPGPVILFCREEQKANLIYVRTRSGNIQLAINSIEKIIKKHNPAYPLEFTFVDDQFNKLYMNETLISKVSAIFALLAIFISCFGLFGLAAFSAEQRKKEIGIRKVLGATVAGLAALLSKEFLRLVAVACLIAFPFAWWMMTAWLQNYQYRINISWWIFPSVYFAAVVIAGITIGFHTIKTAISNPVSSLRSE